MAESASERTILKILSGLQAGVEVALVPGEYSVGSGADDDIQLVDVSLKPAHLKVRVAAGEIRVAGGSGAFRTSRGLVVAQGNQDWQEIEPLEVVVAGTTRFALGVPTAQWATITDDDSAATADPLASRRAAQAKAVATGGGNRRLTVIALSVALASVAGAYAYQVAGPSQKTAAAMVRDEVEVLREKLDAMSFGRSIEVRREVDGTIYATGYVDSQVQRRAVANTVEKTGIPVHLRVWVLQVVRNEIDSLIKARKLAVSANVAPTGEAVLQGVVLDPAVADRFVGLVRDSVVGLKSLDSQIRTAPVLLKEVERLAGQSQVNPYVIFRLDRDLIEVSGAIPIDRIDAWVGFLQSYSGRYAKDIGLRSLVQIQAESGERIQTRPIVIGGSAVDGEVQLDLDKLRVGDYDVNELFGGKKGDRGPLPASGPQPSAAGSLASGLGPRASLFVSDAAAAAGGGAAPARFGSGATIVPAASTADGRRLLPGGGGLAGAGVGGGGAGGLVAGGGGVFGGGGTGGAAGSGGRGFPGSDGLAGADGLPGAVGRAGAAGQPGAPGSRDLPASVSGLVDGSRLSGSAGRIAERFVGGRDLPSWSGPGAAAAPGAPGAVPTSGPGGSVGRAAGVAAGGGSGAQGGPSVSGPGFSAPGSAGPGGAGGGGSGAQGGPSVSGPGVSAPGGAGPGVAGVGGMGLGGSGSGGSGVGGAGSGGAGIAGAGVGGNGSADGDGAAAGGPAAAGGRPGSGPASPGLAGAGGVPGSDPALPRTEAEKVDAAVRDMARAGWDSRSADGAPGGRTDRVAAVYLPLFRRQAELPDQPCWPGSALSVSNLPGTLFWLDLLSVSTELSLVRLTAGEQRVLLEAALNPRRTYDCARQVPNAPGGRGVADASLYLAETRRNPDFIRFVARDMALYPLEVTGASLADEYRYLQVRTGVKMAEGGAPDGATRIAVVGELGAVIQTADGNAVVLFDPDMNWLTSRF